MVNALNSYEIISILNLLKNQDNLKLLSSVIVPVQFRKVLMWGFI